MSISARLGTLLHETILVHGHTSQYLANFENTIEYALEKAEAGHELEAEAILRFAKTMSRPVALLLDHDPSAVIGVMKDGKPEFFK